MFWILVTVNLGYNGIHVIFARLDSNRQLLDENRSQDVIDAGYLAFLQNNVFVAACAADCHVSLSILVAVWLYGHPLSLNVRLCSHFPSILVS